MKSISGKVIERLTLYHCILNDLVKSGNSVSTITSSEIAELLHIDDSQVRRDISILNNCGKSRVGYIISELKSAIEGALGFAKKKNACVVGAGNLGLALSKYDNFINYGLDVKALFDNDPLKIGVEINGKPIYHVSKLSEISKKENIEMVILTVPRKFAQSTADLIVQAGVKYIWNFSTKILNVPKNVIVWNENLLGNLLQFIYLINEN